MMKSDDAALEEQPMILTGIEVHSRSGRGGFEDRKRGNSKRVAPDLGGQHLFKSGPLGKCDDPLCTTCPAYFPDQPPRGARPRSHQKKKATADFIGKGWSAVVNFCRNPLAVINPHARFMQRWNKVFVISCLIGVFLDPLFFFLLAVDDKRNCIMIDQNASTTIIVLRSFTDSIYLMHILLQFRLAFVAPSFRLQEPQSQRQLGQRKEVSATRDIVDDPKKIAWKYLKGWLIIDLIAVLPLPQIMMKVVLPKYLGKASGANYAKNVLRVTLLFQNVPRIIRILPLLSGHTSSGFIFETAWANFAINLLLYLLAGHGVGSLWYLFGLQRVNRCLHDACKNASGNCTGAFLDCGVDVDGFNSSLSGINSSELRQNWKNNVNASGCFASQVTVFTYGIYGPAVPLTTLRSAFSRYIYSVFWGFQQISTLAGNQIPSLFIWEVLFLMTVIGLGLLLLTLLIGNMQNFLQALGRRALEMQLRRYEVEKWMTRRHLPLDLKRRVRQYERFTWAATRGVNEDELLRDLPEDLNRTIRQTLFIDLVKKVRLLEVMDQQLLDAIFQRLSQKLYIDRCEILRSGGPVERMLFIVHGTLESWGDDGSVATLRGGDICGEELLTWCLEHVTGQEAQAKRARLGNITGQRAISSRTVICQSNVEAFSLEARDLEEVTRDFERLLVHPTVRAAIRYESNFMRSWAAVTIQVWWRYNRKKLGRASSSRLWTLQNEQEKQRQRARARAHQKRPIY